MNKIAFLFVLFISNICFAQIQFTANKANGIYHIPCKVNGVPMDFIFDTGASKVSISLTEAKFLIKNGLLVEDDIKQSVRYQIASGEIKEGTEIILQEIEIDGYIIKDVSATIVFEQNAPLLLGLSALNKLGKVELQDGILKIYPKVDSINNEKIFLNTKSILTKALSFKDDNTETNCLFKENFLGIQTLVNLQEPDYEYFEPTISEYEVKSKDYAFLQSTIIIQNNQAYVKRLLSSGIDIIAFMFDYNLADKKTRMVYAVSTKMLIDLGSEPSKEEFEKILIKQ